MDVLDLVVGRWRRPGESPRWRAGANDTDEGEAIGSFGRGGGGSGGGRSSILGAHAPPGLRFFLICRVRWFRFAPPPATFLSCLRHWLPGVPGVPAWAVAWSRPGRLLGRSVFLLCRRAPDLLVIPSAAEGSHERGLVFAGGTAAELIGRSFRSSRVETAWRSRS